MQQKRVGGLKCTSFLARKLGGFGWTSLQCRSKPQRIWYSVLAGYGVPSLLLASATKCCKQLQTSSGEYGLSDKYLGHSSLQCLLCWSAQSWKTWSAHSVLRTVLAGMQPLEAFCTSSSLTVLLNHSDGDKVAFSHGLAKESCFLFTRVFF